MKSVRALSAAALPSALVFGFGVGFERGGLLAARGAGGLAPRRRLLHCSSSQQDGAGSTPIVDAAMVKRTAVLAMLEVTDDEAEKMVPHFKDFLRFVDTMNEVEGKRGASVEVRQEDKLVTDSYHGFLREDETKLFAKTGNILDNMPVEEDGYLLVPRVGGEVD